MNYARDLDLAEKKVLLRVDFNVPIKDGQVADSSRIEAALPTINYLLQQKAKVILCSHLGKPKGKRVTELSLRCVAEELKKLLNKDVFFCDQCLGEQVRQKVEELKPGEILLLENLRFHPGETENDPEFAQGLAELAEVYLNDAFGVVHRAHASVAKVTEYVKECGAGLLLEKEITYLSKIRDEQFERPLVAVLGGVKISTKLGVLHAFLNKADKIIVGGAMANTFLVAMGYDLGKSFYQEDHLQEAKEILEKAKQKKIPFYLPVDFICSPALEEGKKIGVYPLMEVSKDQMVLDIGPASSTLYAEALRNAKTVIWNGPMGAFENSVFAQGSLNLAEDIARINGLSIVGGGDTVALIKKTKLWDKYSFISTGGGSFLQFLEGRDLPGLVALKKCKE